MQNGDKYCLPEGLKFHHPRLNSEKLKLNTIAARDTIYQNNARCQKHGEGETFADSDL